MHASPPSARGERNALAAFRSPACRYTPERAPAPPRSARAPPQPRRATTRGRCATRQAPSLERARRGAPPVHRPVAPRPCQPGAQRPPHPTSRARARRSRAVARGAAPARGEASREQRRGSLLASSPVGALASGRAPPGHNCGGVVAVGGVARRRGARSAPRSVVKKTRLPCPLARQQKMRSDGNSFPSGRKVLTEGLKEAAAGGPE